MRLEFDRVTLRFGDHAIINNLTADLAFDHALAFVGPSGGGKSTLLRLVAGLLTPNSGSIRVNGVSVPHDPVGLRQYRSRIGTVFQAYNLFPHLSALENIVLPLVVVHQTPRRDATARALEILDRFQLTAHSNKRPAELSGGQRQRIAIARALAIQPEFLLFDEPTSALDPEMTAEVLDVITELRAEGRSLIVVSHEMGFVRQTADTVAFIAGGAIAESGPGPALFDFPQAPVTRRFLQRILRY